MAGEEPEMAGEILGGILVLSVDGFVGFFDDFCALRFCVPVMRVDVIEEYGEALGSGAEQGGSRSTRTDTLDHDLGVAGAELRAVGRIPVTEVFLETEDASEPGDGVGDVRIGDVRHYSINRHGAVFHDDCNDTAGVAA